MNRLSQVTKVFATGCVVSVWLGSFVFAQDEPTPQPTKHHKWLTKFVGIWESSGKGLVGEGQPPVETKGTIEAKMLGGFWLTNTMKADVDGMAFTGVQTIGYSSRRKKYVGTWVDTTNDFLWVYEGFVDESGKKLVLETNGPDLKDPSKMRTYRDAYEFKSDNELIVTSSIENEDGSWKTFMNGTSKRIKKQRSAVETEK